MVTKFSPIPSLANFDVITDFNANANNDLFLVTTGRTSFTNAGAVATLDNTGIIAKLTTANFGTNSAAQFTFGIDLLWQLMMEQQALAKPLMPLLKSLV